MLLEKLPPSVHWFCDWKSIHTFKFFNVFVHIQVFNVFVHIQESTFFGWWLRFEPRTFAYFYALSIPTELCSQGHIQESTWSEILILIRNEHFIKCIRRICIESYHGAVSVNNVFLCDKILELLLLFYIYCS
jgi:hypothetical protein